MCGQSNEAISHIASGCPKLAQKEYKKRHDKVVRAITGSCQENTDLIEKGNGMTMFKIENYKLVCDFSLRTDHEIDLAVINKRENSCQIRDVAVAEDGRMRGKEDEKVEKYQDLAREVQGCGG